MKLNYKKKFYFGLMALFLAGMGFSTVFAAKTTNKSKIVKSISADNAIMDVKSYGFVDLEGAKTSAIIVEYNQNIKADSVDKMIMRLQIMRFTARKKMVLRKLWKLIEIVRKEMKDKLRKFMSM